MTREYVEVFVATAADAGELLACIEEAGCQGACEQNGGISLYWVKENWNEESRSALVNALAILGDPSAAATIAVIDIPDQDWNARWTASLQPIQLGRRALIRQSWNPAPVPAGGFALVIDPKRAFGTGYHATTQLIALWLEELVRGGECVLDVGTGSGILAMMALRFGARSSQGIDNDPEAIECASEYALANRFGGELELKVAALEDLENRKYDLILANLDRRTLWKYFSVFPDYLALGGRLVVSGLQREDREEAITLAESCSWRVEEVREREEWIAMALALK